MSEGPYRDLGHGFARLSGAEAPRRAPSSISSVEDALFELLRNSRDAGASNVFVASTLRRRRYRSLTVIDDGCGVPAGFEDLIFSAGVTTRHLDPTVNAGSPHGAGLSLHHIRNAAVEARLTNPASPTAIRAVFDTRTLPERSLQSKSRASRSNLLATTNDFAANHRNLNLFYATPAKILATLKKNHIIQRIEAREESKEALAEAAKRVGLEVSSKTAGRLLRGEIPAARRIFPELERGSGGYRGLEGEGKAGAAFEFPTLNVREDERAEISAILGRIARASYLEVVDVKFESRPGEVSIKARIHEPEDEFE